MEKKYSKIALFFLAVVIIVLCVLIYFIYKVDISKSQFQNVIPPYIAQSVYIKVFLSSAKVPAFKWVLHNNVKLKGTLVNNILVTSNDGNARVFVPKTVENIPIELYVDSSLADSKIILVANDIEQEIKQCDLITTIY